MLLLGWFSWISNSYELRKFSVMCCVLIKLFHVKWPYSSLRLFFFYYTNNMNIEHTNIQIFYGVDLISHRCGNQNWCHILALWFSIGLHTYGWIMTNIHFIEAMLRFLLCKRALTKLWNNSAYLKRHFDSRSGCTFFFLFFFPFILSQFCKCKMWEIRFRSSGCCFSIFCFVFISLTTADRSFQCWCREKKCCTEKKLLYLS